jgi:TRAP-type uncharacterized transport system substrate-binding protein
MAGDCEVAIVQNDSYWAFRERHPGAISTLERHGYLYWEYVHLVCNNTSKISDVSDLTSKTPIEVGPPDSGTSGTWDAFVLADQRRFGNVDPRPHAGNRALDLVLQGDDVQCLLNTSGLNGVFMRDVNAQGDQLHLVPATDSALFDIKDEHGKPIYEKSVIPGGTYSKLQHGFFSTSVSTVRVQSVFVIRTDWADAHEDFLAALEAAEHHAEPAIHAKTGGDQ